MANLSGFLSQNAIKIENKFVAISNRFLDENKKPLDWELKALEAEEGEEIRRKSMVKVPVDGKPNRHTMELDQNKYLRELCVASVVFPSLYDAELQDSYGVKTPSALLMKMLMDNEYALLSSEVADINNLTESFDELVDEAKN